DEPVYGIDAAVAGVGLIRLGSRFQVPGSRFGLANWQLGTCQRGTWNATGGSQFVPAVEGFAHHAEHLLGFAGVDGGEEAAVGGAGVDSLASSAGLDASGVVALLSDEAEELALRVFLALEVGAVL